MGISDPLAPLIQFIGAVKRFDEKVVLDGFDWEIPFGSRVCLGGPSGVGKTTLLRILAGLDRLDSGSVIGLPGVVSYQFQEDRLLPWYTARRNLSLITDEPDVWLERVGLGGEGSHYPDELSGGMRRRLSLAKALATPAPLLLLDEPFKELDADSKARIMELVRGQSDGRRGWIILVTHDPRDAEALGFEYKQL
ncbi:sulfate transporter [Clostridia bacterium]|nr:sulfate transporter [Clostridia bacterium]